MYGSSRPNIPIWSDDIHSIYVEAWFNCDGVPDYTTSATVSGRPTESTLPTLTITSSPQWNEHVHGNVSISFYATDASGLKECAIDIVGESPLNYDNFISSAASSMSYSWNISSLQSGWYRITCYATDIFGNTASEDAARVYVDNTGPAVGNLYPEDYYVKGIVSLGFSSYDYSGVSSLKIKIDSSEVSNNSFCLWNSIGHEGVHIIDYFAWDVFGNEGHASKTIFVDNIAPLLQIVRPLNNATVEGTVDISFTADDGAGSGINPDSEAITVAKDVVVKASFVGNRCLWDSTTVGDGVYTIQATASDWADNWGDATPIQIHVDNPPFIPTGLQAIDTGEGHTIDLCWNWSGHFTNLDSFKIYRSLTPNFTPSDSDNLIASENGYDYSSQNGQTYNYSYVDENCPSNNVNVYYKIIATENTTVNNTSAPSNEVCGLPTIAPPKKFAATDAQIGTTVNLNWVWDRSLNHLISFEIYRDTNAVFNIDPTKHIASVSWWGYITGTQYSYTFRDKSNLTNKTSYYYKIVSVDDSVTNNTSNYVQTVATPTIAPPTNLTVVAQGSKLFLSWNWQYDSVNLYGFYIYRGESPDFSLNKDSWLGYISANSPFGYTDSQLTLAKPYYYKVTAVDWSWPNDESLPSNEASGTPQAPSAPVPSVPTGLAITNPGTGSELVLNWNTNPLSDNIAYYNLYESNFPNISANIYLKIYPCYSSQQQTSGLIEGLPYYYRISAVNIYGKESDLGAVVSGTPIGIPNPPGLVGIPMDTQVGLAWVPTSSNVAGYNVYRSLTSGGSYSEINQNIVVNNTYQDSGLQNGTSYYYIIKAVNKYDTSVLSPASNEIEITPAITNSNPPARPVIYPTPRSTEIYFSWTPNLEADWVETSLYTYTQPGGPYTKLYTATKAGNEPREYTHSGLNPETTYYYIITAKNSSGIENPVTSDAGIPVSTTATPIVTIDDISPSVIDPEGIVVPDRYANITYSLNLNEKESVLEVYSSTTQQLVYKIPELRPKMTASPSPYFRWLGLTLAGDYAPAGLYDAAVRIVFQSGEEKVERRPNAIEVKRRTSTIITAPQENEMVSGAAAPITLSYNLSSISSVTLNVGGTFVKGYSGQPPTLYWDTTQFPHNSTIKISVDAFDANNQLIGRDWKTVKVYNVGFAAAAIEGIEDRVTTAGSALANMHYNTTILTASQVNKNIIIQNIKPSTVIQINCHGSLTQININGTLAEVPILNLTQEDILPSDISTEVQKKGDIPDYEFVLLDACYSANTDDFLTAFNAKAMIGLLGTVYGGNEREFIKKFWELIQTTNEGKPYTIKAAMADAVEAVKDPYFKVDQLHGVKCLGDGNLILHIPAEIAKDQTLR